MWDKIKAFFAKVKQNAVYIAIAGAIVFLLIYGRRILAIFGIFSNTTERLREEKEKEGKTYTATQTNVQDNSTKPERNPSTKKVADDLIAENEAMIEKLKKEGK